MIGLASYVVIINAWMFAPYAKGWQADLAPLPMFGMAVSGTLFLYLTILEPFVIGQPVSGA
jgi:hypothetical protein